MYFVAQKFQTVKNENGKINVIKHFFSGKLPYAIISDKYYTHNKIIFINKNIKNPVHMVTAHFTK